jgi:molecular chaperone GrpE
MKNEAEKMNPDAENEGGMENEAAQENPVSTALTQEQVEQLMEKAAKADEYRDRMLREAADFENFKKRAARERQDAIKYANESVLKNLIPIIDNFEMALGATAGENVNIESLKQGIGMVHSLLKKSLNEAGLEEIDATGQPFDPTFHEAVSQKETTEVPDGHVVQQMRKGYKFRDRLLRPASVVVAKKP